MSKKN
jgi:hypothetical protein